MRHLSSSAAGEEEEAGASERNAAAIRVSSSADDSSTMQNAAGAASSTAAIINTAEQSSSNSNIDIRDNRHHAQSSSIPSSSAMTHDEHDEESSSAVAATAASSLPRRPQQQQQRRRYQDHSLDRIQDPQAFLRMMADQNQQPLDHHLPPQIEAVDDAMFAAAAASNSLASSGTNSRTRPTPFPQILYRMVDTAHRRGFDHIVSWCPHGRAFQIYERNLFEQVVLPRYFATARFASFARQLHFYQFHRIDNGPDNGSFFHEYFLRGRPDLIPIGIQRLTPPQPRRRRRRSQGRGGGRSSSPTASDAASGHEDHDDNNDDNTSTVSSSMSGPRRSTTTRVWSVDLYRFPACYVDPMLLQQLAMISSTTTATTGSSADHLMPPPPTRMLSLAAQDAFQQSSFGWPNTNSTGITEIARVDRGIQQPPQAMFHAEGSPASKRSLASSLAATASLHQSLYPDLPPPESDNPNVTNNDSIMGTSSSQDLLLPFSTSQPTRTSFSGSTPVPPWQGRQQQQSPQPFFAEQQHPQQYIQPSMDFSPAYNIAASASGNTNPSTLHSQSSHSSSSSSFPVSSSSLLPTPSSLPRASVNTSNSDNRIINNNNSTQPQQVLAHTPFSQLQQVQQHQFLSLQQPPAAESAWPTFASGDFLSSNYPVDNDARVSNMAAASTRSFHHQQPQPSLQQQQQQQPMEQISPQLDSTMLDAFRNRIQRQEETGKLPAAEAATNMQTDDDDDDDTVINESLDTIRGFPFTGPVGSVGARDSVTGTYSIVTTTAVMMDGSGGGANDETEDRHSNEP